MGIEQYNKGRETPGRGYSNPNIGEMGFGVNAQEGIDKIFRGIGSFFERKEKPTGVELYNQPEYRSFMDRVIPGSDKFMTEEYVRPFGKWASETVPKSFKKWNQSYQKGSPITGDTSRDYKSQFGDIGKWLVNTPATWGTFGADVATDIGESSVAMLPKWAGGEGRGLFSKDQKYQWDAAAVDKFGIESFYEDNPYTKYDWTKKWTEETNPILKEVQDTTDKHMYENFLTEDVEGGIWDEIISETGYDNLIDKTKEDQSDLFGKKFFEMYRDDWDMNWQYEKDRILKKDYDLGSKGTPGAISEFELDFNYDPMIPYSTEETGFLEGSTKGLGIALSNFAGPGMFSRGRKFIPKWRKKAGIMDAAKGTKYEGASQYFDGI